MCGICNVVRCITGRGYRRETGCDCDSYNNRARWCEPRMNIRCASGIGTASDSPCGCEQNCGCGCNRRRSECRENHERECERYCD